MRLFKALKYSDLREIGDKMRINSKSDKKDIFNGMSEKEWNIYIEARREKIKKMRLAIREVSCC